MTKQEQIEELASLMADCNTTCDECFEKYERVMTMKIKEREKYCQAYAYAQRAVKQGYRKIPKDAVVLLVGEYNQPLDEKTIEYFVNHNEQVRKETAKEILQAVGRESNGQTISITNYLRKKYGVEVEE